MESVPVNPAGPADPTVPRVGILSYFWLEQSLLATGELLYVPQVGDVVVLDGDQYQVVGLQWGLNNQPLYNKWVSVSLVYIAITPQQAAMETSLRKEGK